MKYAKFRQLSPGDTEAYRDICLESLQLYPQSFAANYQDWYAKTRSQWTEHLEAGLVFGGFIGDRLMGTVSLEIDGDEHSAYLFSLYVRESAKCQGFAKAMVKYTLDYATTYVSRVHLRVVHTNTIAQRFFTKLGFEIYGVTVERNLERSRFMLEIALTTNQPQYGIDRNLATMEG